MKMKTLFLCAALIPAINVGTVSAGPLTVYITAHVSFLDDSTGILGGQLAVGQTATASYTYETTVPDQNPDAMYGDYPQGYWQASSRISAGAVVFESAATSPNWYYDVSVHPSNYPGYYESAILRC